MKPKKINDLLLLSLALVFVTCPQKSHANKNHPFYHDVKQAYQDSKLVYDFRIENILYSKLPKPGHQLPKPRSAEEEQIMVQTIEALHRQFFKKVKTGGQYCSAERIRIHFGQTPKERIGISSGGYYYNVSLIYLHINFFVV